MKSNYRKLTNIFILLNIIGFATMLAVYVCLNIKALSIYAFLSVLAFLGIIILRNKIPELFTIFLLCINLVVYSVFFYVVAKKPSGIELYPMILIGLSYMLSYELKKPKFICFCFSIISALVCLTIKVSYNLDNDVILPYPNSLYKLHEIFATIMIIFALMILNHTYEKILTKKNENEQKQKDELIYIANHDPLTGLMNRRRIWEHLHFCENQKKEKDINYVISIFDIDYFKRVNDTYGHACGDFILVEISNLIKENLSRDVKIARWGGEEFLLLYKGYSDEKAIIEIEEIRKLIDETFFDFLGTKIHITLTFGVSSSLYCDTAEHIIIDADKQLMKGKIQGKNRVVARHFQKSIFEDDSIFDSFIDAIHKD